VVGRVARGLELGADGHLAAWFSSTSCRPTTKPPSGNGPKANQKKALVETCRGVVCGLGVEKEEISKQREREEKRGDDMRKKKKEETQGSSQREELEIQSEISAKRGDRRRALEKDEWKRWRGSWSLTCFLANSTALARRSSGGVSSMRCTMS